MRLQIRDRLILELVADYRFLTSLHLHELLGQKPGYRALAYRLRKLWANGFLERLWLPQRFIGAATSKRDPTHAVYTLTKKGAETLGRDDAADWPKALSLQTARHLLDVNDIRVAIVSAVRRFLGKPLPFWCTEPELHRIIRGGRPRSSAHDANHLRIVVPDGFFATPAALGNWRDKGIEAERSKSTFAGMGRTGYFFLELDRGTTRLHVMRNRYRRYVALFRSRLLHELFRVPHFRVLTVTTSEKRVLNLIAIVRKDLHYCQGMFWFAHRDPKVSRDSKDDLSSDNILRKVWRRASDDKRHSILD